MAWITLAQAFPLVGMVMVVARMAIAVAGGKGKSICCLLLVCVLLEMKTVASSWISSSVANIL